MNSFNRSQSQNTKVKESKTRLEEILNMGGMELHPNPIILVLAAPTSGGLSIDNAKEFLERGVYNAINYLFYDD